MPDVQGMRPFVHPPVEDITLSGVLYALSDPARLAIIRALAGAGDCLSCSQAAPEALPKSTLSHHYRILREAGLIRSERRGAEVRNTLRCQDVDRRFPGLLPKVLEAAGQSASRA